MVADVLQLPEVVGGHQHRGAVPGHIVQHQAPDLPPHDGVQPIHRLVQDQILGVGSQGQVKGRLLLHSLAEPADGISPGQLEYVLKFVEALFVKPGVDPGIKALHVQKACPREIEGLIRHTADFFLYIMP